MTCVLGVEASHVWPLVAWFPKGPGLKKIIWNTVKVLKEETIVCFDILSLELMKTPATAFLNQVDFFVVVLFSFFKWYILGKIHSLSINLWIFFKYQWMDKVQWQHSIVFPHNFNTVITLGRFWHQSNELNRNSWACKNEWSVSWFTCCCGEALVETWLDSSS